MKQTLLRPFVLAALIVLFLWPAVWNRGPFYFIDTRTYMRSEDAAINRLTHHRTAWTADNEESAAPASAAAQTADQSLHNVGEARTRSLEDIKKKGIVLGRSLYYGLVLYAGAITTQFWLTIVFQAAVLLLTLYLTLRALLIPVWPAVAWLCLGLCVLSDVAFFTSYLMPDLFAGITILCCAILLSIRHRLTRMEYALWFLLLTFSLLSHDTCLLISTLFLGLAIVINLFRRSWGNLEGLALILLAAISAYAGQSLVTYGVARATGQQPLRFPLIEARLVADSPGTNFLRATCPQSHFMLCEYVNEFPMSSYDFLFGTDPGKSVYEMATYDRRRALSNEQFRFLFAVLRYDPAGFLKASFRNTAGQFLDFKLSSFRYGVVEKDTMDRTFPLQVLTQIHRGAAYRGTMPTPALTVLEYVFAIGSVVYLLLAISRQLPGRTMSKTVKWIFFWVAAGVVLNAAICGGISAIESRYQARVVWLLPLVALLVESQLRFRRGNNLALQCTP